jgi:ubiquitin carboxyl-terminal hydrolase 7
VSVLVSRQATIEEIIQALVKKLPSIPTEVYDRIRLFDVRGHREYREFQPTQTLSIASLDTYGTSYFAEPVPLEEDDAGEHDRYIIIVHFAKDITRLHGVPLKFVVKPVLPFLQWCLFAAGIVV